MNKNSQQFQQIPETSISSETTAVQIPVTVTPKKKLSIFVLLIISIALIAVSVTGYLGYEKYNLNRSKSILNPPTEPSIKPSGIQNLTTLNSSPALITTPTSLPYPKELLRYSDDVYKISFYYSASWSVNKSNIGNTPSSKVKQGMIPYLIEVKSNGPGKIGWVEINPEGGHDANVNPQMVSTKITIAGIDVLKYQFKPNNGFTTYDFSKSIFKEMNITSQAYSQQDETIIDQILFTLDSAALDPYSTFTSTPGFKTFTNTKYAFEITYPDNGLTQYNDNQQLSDVTYYRIQNYKDKGGDFPLESNEYYFEISVYNNSYVKKENISCSASAFSDYQKIQIGTYTGYQGIPLEIGEGGHLFNLCLETPEYFYFVGGRDGTKNSSIIKSILSTFKFTK